MHNNDAKTVAKVILKQFPDTSLNDLEEVVKRYKKIEAWPKTTEFTKESFQHMQEIMMKAEQLEKTVSFEDLIYEK